MTAAGIMFCRSSAFRMPKSSSICPVNAVIEIDVSLMLASFRSAVTTTSSIWRRSAGDAVAAVAAGSSAAETVCAMNAADRSTGRPYEHGLNQLTDDDVD